MTNAPQIPDGRDSWPQQGQQQHGAASTPPWAASTLPSGAPAPQPPRGGGRRTAIVSVCAAAAVVVAAGTAGFLVLGGKDDGKPEAGPTPAGSVSPSGTRGEGPADDTGPLVPGWKTVVNPKRGIAFDVPVQWAPKPTGWVSYVAEDSDPEEIPLVGFSAPAILKEKWCLSDEDHDGTQEEPALASAGSRGESGARGTEEAARENARLWVYGKYAQPDQDKVTPGSAVPFTTKSGLAGSVATATSSGVTVKDRCDFDGKATAFAFKDANGETVSWTFVGVRGVADEVPDGTVREILSTVRLIDGTS